MAQQTDVDTLVTAVEDARIHLGRYIEPGERHATKTVEALLEILDDKSVVAALDHLSKRRAMRLVEVTSPE